MLRGGGGAAPPPTGPGAREPGAGAGSIGTEVNSTPPLGVLVILIWWPAQEGSIYCNLGPFAFSWHSMYYFNKITGGKKPF